MDLLKKLKGHCKELFAYMAYGGEPMTDKWGADTDVKNATEAYVPVAGKKAEGHMFLMDMKELYQAIEKFNESREPEMQFRIVIDKEYADKFVPDLLREGKSLFGYTHIDGFALERNGRVYEGRYFNDCVYNSGFAFEMQGTETKFQCGLEKKSSFENFVLNLLNPPPAYPYPLLPRFY